MDDAASRSSSITTSYSFVVLADIQGGWASREDWLKVVQFVEQLSPRPDFVVIVGDMVQRKKEVGQFPDPVNVAGFREGLERLENVCPVYVLPGNHDVGDLHDVPSPERLDWYRREIHPRLYLQFSFGKDLFILLDSNSLKFPTSDIQQHTDDQVSFFRTQMNRAPEFRHVVLLLHHPIRLGDIERASVAQLGKFLAGDMATELVRSGAETHSNFRLVISGHTHHCDVSVDETGVNHVNIGSCTIPLQQWYDENSGRVVLSVDVDENFIEPTILKLDC